MKTITPDKYVEGIKSIYVEHPAYQLGHDGSDGKCDCIGMVRGGLKREGITAEGLSGTNYAARHTIRNLDRILATSQLQKGDVVLKVRDADDKSMPLPDRYRKGGADYDSTWGETNFTHIGTVTNVYPLEITHMTSPTAKIDTQLGTWQYFGQLPWVSGNAAEDPEPDTEWVRVWAEKGSTVKMRAKPSTSCKLYWDVPIGSDVMLLEAGETWCKIRWAGQDGYMMTKFLMEQEPLPVYGVIISNLTRAQAEEIVAQYGGEITAG